MVFLALVSGINRKRERQKGEIEPVLYGLPLPHCLYARGQIKNHEEIWLNFGLLEKGLFLGLRKLEVLVYLNLKVKN